MLPGRRRSHSRTPGETVAFFPPPNSPRPPLEAAVSGELRAFSGHRLPNRGTGVRWGSGWPAQTQQPQAGSQAWALHPRSHPLLSKVRPNTPVPQNTSYPPSPPAPIFRNITGLTLTNRGEHMQAGALSPAALGPCPARRGLMQKRTFRRSVQSQRWGLGRPGGGL